MDAPAARNAPRGERGAVFLRLLRYVRPYWREMGLAFVFMSFYAVMNGAAILMFNPFMRLVMSVGRPGVPAPMPFDVAHPQTLIPAARVWLERQLLDCPPLEAITRVCLLILASFILKNAFNYVQNVTMQSVEQRVIRDLRNALYRHVQELGLAFFHTRRTGMLISRIMNDVTLVRGTITAASSTLVRDSLMLLVGMSIVLSLSWRLAMVSFVVLPPAGWFIVTLGRRLRRHSEVSQERMGDMTTVLQETLSGIRVVKSFGMEGYETRRFEDVNRRQTRATLRVRRLGAMAGPLAEILTTAVALLVLWVGAHEIWGTHTLAGNDFFVFFLAMLSMMNPIKNLSNLNPGVQEGLLGAQRVFRLLDTQEKLPERADAVELTGLGSGIRVEGVSFRYGDGPLVLRDVRVEVKPGQVVAVVGPSGAGKSTLADLLMRFYDPAEGCIRVDGHDLRDVRTPALRRLVGMVPQETILFNDSVRSNIAYGQQDVPLERVEEAARAANAHDFIRTLSEGYESVIGERGVKLSGGQRQRIAIARALLRNPPLLILDEATSSLDTESERLVQEALDRLMQQRTVVVIAHRLSTIERADHIVVLDQGRVVEEGVHAELLARGGLYRRLYDVQFRTPPGLRRVVR
ncbi:MAG: ABC transporter ATP-binding protein [Candidatus Eisenbacteria bacterium]|nr:ABC transporter ATP-binding protein [Candidatus Eisenbacteria bacterium]